MARLNSGPGPSLGQALRRNDDGAQADSSSDYFISLQRIGTHGNGRLHSRRD